MYLFSHATVEEWDTVKAASCVCVCVGGVCKEGLPEEVISRLCESRRVNRVHFRKSVLRRGV